MAETSDPGTREDCESQLNALRESTARIQHDINNPLAALLVEAQLLDFEPTLPDEHRAAVRRIIELSRRVIVGVRALDEVRGAGGAP